MEFTFLQNVYVYMLIGSAGLFATLIFLWLSTALIVVAEYQKHDNIR